MIDYKAEGAIANITLNRPKKQNALTTQAVLDLLTAVRRAGEDDGVKAIVLRGEGKSFCAGFDVTDPADFEGGADESRRARIDNLTEKARWMRELFAARKPIIVSIHGSCIGIGLYLVLGAPGGALRVRGSYVGLPVSHLECGSQARERDRDDGTALLCPGGA